jgi:fatty acid desaturase
MQNYFDRSDNMTNEQVRIKWYHSAMEKETLQRLTERSDLRGFMQILPQIFLTALGGVGVYFAFRELPLWASIPMFYVYATFYSFLGVSGAGHELCHRTVFKTKFWNEFFLRIVAFLTWTDFVYFRASHTQHHQFTVHKGLDLEVVQPQKIKQSDWLFLFTLNIPALSYVFPPLFRHCFGIVKGEWEERIFPASNTKERSKLFLWARVLVLGHLALAAVFVLSGQWILLLLVSFASFFAVWLNFLCAFTQHVGLQSDVNDLRLSCRTVKLNPLLAYFYWQMNYHVEHHMYAGVPFYNLKKLRETIEEDLPIASSGLTGAWKEILQILHRQKKDPSYFYSPTIKA